MSIDFKEGDSKTYERVFSSSNNLNTDLIFDEKLVESFDDNFSLELNNLGLDTT